MCSYTSLWMFLLNIFLVLTLLIKHKYQENPNAPSLYTWNVDVPSCYSRERQKNFFWNIFSPGYAPTLEEVGIKLEMGRCLETWSVDQTFRPKDLFIYLVQLKEFALWHLSLLTPLFHCFEQKWAGNILEGSNRSWQLYVTFCGQTNPLCVRWILMLPIAWVLGCIIAIIWASYSSLTSKCCFLEVRNKTKFGISIQQKKKDPKENKLEGSFLVSPPLDC